MFQSLQLDSPRNVRRLGLSKQMRQMDVYFDWVNRFSDYILNGG